MDIHIAVVSLRAEDVPTAAHFYQEILGLPVVPHGTDRPHFDLSGTVLTILPGRPYIPENPEPRFPVLAFSVPALDPAIEILRSHGVDLPWGVESNPAGRWVMFHDPAGNLIELVEWVKSS
jgi:catechol 2,3-dioxygenase-like lactoylglutathione lyase family enzyme